jgi:hypothetical protein
MKKFLFFLLGITLITIPAMAVQITSIIMPGASVNNYVPGEWAAFTGQD